MKKIAIILSRCKGTNFFSILLPRMFPMFSISCKPQKCYSTEILDTLIFETNNPHTIL